MDNRKKLGIFKYLNAHKFAISSYVVFSILSSACNVLTTIFLAKAIEFITWSEYKSAIFTILIVGGIYLIQHFCMIFVDYIYYKYSNIIVAELNRDLTKQAFKFTSKTYSEYDTGTFVQRILNDPSLVVNNLTNMVDQIATILTTLTILIYIIVLNIYIGIILVTLISICGLIEFFRTKILKKNKFLSYKKSDKINSLMTEIIRSEKDIKSLGLELTLGKTSEFYYNDRMKQAIKTNTTDLWWQSARNILIKLISVGVLILGIYFVDIGTITLATFMIIYSNNYSVFSFIWCVGHVWSILIEIKVSSKRMFSLFDENLFPCEHFGTTHIDRMQGKIEFQNVSFAFLEYETVESNAKTYQLQRKIVSKTKVLDTISFTIEPNTSVAFVGQSGSGKSTILNLISKMYEVDSGQILIDGIDIKNLDKKTLRDSISLVNQFPYIFDMTIKENLLLAKNNATDEELWQTIDKASLNEFVLSLKNKLDTKVGEGGIKLSGGQKQRLAIARALLRNSPIIIFDESTSSLDNFAQGDIKRSIDELKGKSTIIIVAHRLSTIRDVDKIFFLDNGKIEDVGTFDELFENNVKFKNMFYAENLN